MQGKVVSATSPTMRHAGPCLSPAEIYKACHIPDGGSLGPCLRMPHFTEDMLGR